MNVRGTRREAYALYCDDSGGEADRVRSVAGVSGPARVMLALERDLRQILRVAGMRELKWTAMRKREGRLQAARAFLDLAAIGAAAGAMRIEVLLWRPEDQAPVSRARTEAQRLRPLYARLWSSTARAWPPGRWNVHPDQRTGMRWGEHGPGLASTWKRGGGDLRSIREAVSGRSACVQLADLLAGLLRMESSPAAGGVPAVRARRLGLLSHFAEACSRRGLGCRARDGLLSATGRNLSIRLLRRLPVTV